MNLLETLLTTVFATLVGGTITWWAAWVYYRKAGNELRAEAQGLAERSDRLLVGIGELKSQSVQLQDAVGEVRKQSEHLRDASRDLKYDTTMLLAGLSHAGLIKVMRDESGRITSILAEAVGEARGRATVTAVGASVVAAEGEAQMTFTGAAVSSQKDDETPDGSDELRVPVMDTASVRVSAPPAGVSLQIFFTRYHLHAARMFRDRVATLELEGFSLAHRSYTMGCILSAAAFVEALVNEAFEGVVTGFGRVTDPLPPAALEPLRKACGSIDPKANTLERLERFLVPFGKKAPKGQDPWQSVGLLFDLRNATAHARPVDTAALSDLAQMIEGSLRSRFGDGRKYKLNRQFGANNPFFPDRLLGEGCCKWAVASVEALSAWFGSETGLQPWWEPPAD